MTAPIKKEFWIHATSMAYDFNVMSDSPTVHVISADWVESEINKLKARLLDFEGRTFSENEEITKLKAEIERLNNYVVGGYEEMLAESQKQVQELVEALEFECGNRCNAEYNPCNAITILSKHKLKGNS